MLNKLLAFQRQYKLMEPGDTIVCAVSGGADSMALLWSLYLLKEKLGIQLQAAHFNHHLRGAESDRDEAFVREFCDRYDIPLAVGSGNIVPGEKGIEAAARDVRYAFLQSLPGKIATAHTANDNAETVLMRLVRGTGLKGLGAISPVRGNVIRPMLTVTRPELMLFLEEYHISYVDDSSNGEDAFLRNRIRHHVMPLLEQENPRLAQNLSAMALRLREDEILLSQTVPKAENRVEVLRQMDRARRSRALQAFLEGCGVKEPEAEHIALAESLVFSDNPSAKACFPNAITITRCYTTLEVLHQDQELEAIELPCPGMVVLNSVGLRVSCEHSQPAILETNCFTVQPVGKMIIRPRQAGDSMRLHGGSKSLKKIFTDKKIPAAQRGTIPVIADEAGVLGVYGIGANLDRAAQTDGVRICFEKEREDI